MDKSPIFVVISTLITILIFSPSAKFDLLVEGKPVWGPAGEKKCTSDFFSRTCCWIDDDGGAIHQRCETCIDNGDGTYSNCKIKDGPVASKTPTKPPKGSINDNLNKDLTTSGKVLEKTPESHSSNTLSQSDNLDKTTGLSKKGSGSGTLNDNSPTPPACPDKGPIPPNCTMKPKF